MFAMLRKKVLGDTAATRIERLEPTELHRRLVDADPALVLDVREPDEFAAWHIPGARNLPLRRVRDRAHAVARTERKVVLVCFSGARATRAAELLQVAGLRDLAVLHGGTAAWRHSHLPLEGGLSAEDEFAG
ncbi:protein of unknown function [Rhodovastum atsumiense]|nr:rhodanese-like domain-containing protein [Rhodovastum atsumiense]CAH2601688.1 protein of unknown function [Rhodovastum atsumiense]